MPSLKISRFLVILPALIILVLALLFSKNFLNQTEIASKSFEVENRINHFSQLYKTHLDLVLEKRTFQSRGQVQNRTNFDSLNNLLSDHLDSLYREPLVFQQFEMELEEFRAAYERRLEQLNRHVSYFARIPADSARNLIASEYDEIQQLSAELDFAYQNFLTLLLKESRELKRDYYSIAQFNFTWLILLFGSAVFLIFVIYFLGKKHQKVALEKQIQKGELDLLQKDMLEFRTTFEFAAIGMALVDEEGKWLRVNPSLQRMLNYSEEELKRMSFQEITHPDDLFADLEQAKRLRNREIDSYTIEKRYLTKSGTILWINLTGTAVWESDGSFRYFIAQIENITEARETAMAIEQSERKFRGIFNSTFQFIGFLDPDGTLQEANQTAMGFAGLSHEDVVGKKFWDCFWWQISPETQEKLRLSIEKAAQGEFIQYEVAVWDKSKNPVTILFNLKPILDSDGKVIAIVPEGRLIQDIVDVRKSLIEKNMELERFASVASHDLKEPLRMVINFLQLLDRKYKGQLDEKADQYIHYAVDAAQRMNILITDLLEYSKVGAENTAMELIDLNEVIAEQIGYFSALLEECGGKVSYPSLPVIQAKKVPINLLFRNLIGNSLKYKKEGVPPEIKIQGKELEDYWEFSIADNGIGFDPESSEVIFEMFKRLHTRQEYSGSGLGLSICKKIVDLHQGKIWAESIPDEGSTFHFTLRKF